MWFDTDSGNNYVYNGVTWRKQETRWVDDLGHHLIQKIEFFIDGQLIPTYPESWLQIYAEVNQANPPNSDQPPHPKPKTLSLK